MDATEILEGIQAIMDGCASIMPTIIALLAALWALGQLSKLTEISQFKERLLRIEDKVDLILEQSGIEYQPFRAASREIARELEQEGTVGAEEAVIVKALRKGEKIEAIKAYRDFAGVDLKAAKTFVEEIEMRLS